MFYEVAGRPVRGVEGVYQALTPQEVWEPFQPPAGAPLTPVRSPAAFQELIATFLRRSRRTPGIDRAIAQAARIVQADRQHQATNRRGHDQPVTPEDEALAQAD